MMQVLSSGKPSLIIPFNGDQMEISRRVENLGLGKRIKKYPDEISSKEVFKNIRELLRNPRYRVNTLKFKKFFKKWENGAFTAAQFIEDTYRNQRVKEKAIKTLFQMRKNNQ
jgi:UDP:flavonoid glycosyltransferase YjiC (YdhE family)